MAEAKPLVGDISELWVWGSDGYGRLGQGTVNKRLIKATKVKGLEGKLIRSIGCGSAHTLLAFYEEEDKEKKLECYSWGKCHFGQLGHNEMEMDESLPKLLTVLGGLKQIKIVGCGQASSFIVAEDGTYSWGCGYYGALGHDNEDHLLKPKLIEGLKEHGSEVKSIKGGAFHTIALTERGLVFTWGRDHVGQLGVKPLSPTTQVRLNHKTPQPVLLPEDGDKIDAFADNTMILMKNGILLSFGDNQHKQLGHEMPSFNANKDVVKGKLECRVEINNKENKKEFLPISDMACGTTHSLAVTRDGKVYSWGRHELGALGRDYPKEPGIVVVEEELELKFTKVSAGHEFSLALACDGRVFSWGENYADKLGRDTHTDKPKVVDPVDPVDGIICAENHSTAFICKK